MVKNGDNPFVLIDIFKMRFLGDRVGTSIHVISSLEFHCHCDFIILCVCAHDFSFRPSLYPPVPEFAQFPRYLKI